MARKFTWGINAKHCWMTSTNIFVFKSFLTMPSNPLTLHLKQTFPPIIWMWLNLDYLLKSFLLYYIRYDVLFLKPFCPTVRNNCSYDLLQIREFTGNNIAEALAYLSLNSANLILLSEAILNKKKMPMSNNLSSFNQSQL